MIAGADPGGGGGGGLWGCNPPKTFSCDKRKKRPHNLLEGSLLAVSNSFLRALHKGDSVQYAHVRYLA